MTIEAKYGVPTVAVHTDKFDRVVRVGGRGERHAGPAPGVRAPADHGQDAGASCAPTSTARDPITGRPVMQEVVEGLTRPLDDDELRPASSSTARRRAWSSPTPRTTCTALFLDNHWTDMLPIVLPTEERVAAMLRAHAAQARRGRRAHAVRRTSASTGSTRSRRSR